MPGISPQAKTLKDAIVAIGVSRSDVSVRTSSRRLTYIDEAGQRHRYTEYGPASAIFRGRDTRERVVAHAQELADKNLSVSVFVHACGHDSHVVIVSTDWNPSKQVNRRLNLDSNCEACR